MRDPNRTDVLLALWSILALDDDDAWSETEPGLAALAELHDDLQRDLQRAEYAEEDLDLALGAW